MGDDPVRAVPAGRQICVLGHKDRTAVATAAAGAPDRHVEGPPRNLAANQCIAGRSAAAADGLGKNTIGLVALGRDCPAQRQGHRLTRAAIAAIAADGAGEGEGIHGGKGHRTARAAAAAADRLRKNAMRVIARRRDRRIKIVDGDLAASAADTAATRVPDGKVPRKTRVDRQIVTAMAGAAADGLQGHADGPVGPGGDAARCGGG